MQWPQFAPCYASCRPASPGSPGSAPGYWRTPPSERRPCPCLMLSSMAYQTGFTRLPIPTRSFSRIFFRRVERSISELVLGVLSDTRLLGRQYSFFPPAPQARPVFWSTHFSFSHRFNSVPFSVLRTDPDAFRHLAMAWLARADGNTSY